MIDWRIHLESAVAEDKGRRTVAHEVLVHAMQHKERRATERLFRLLDLLFLEEDFLRIHRGFNSHDVRERASSAELIEAIVPAPLAGALLAYMDRGSDARRLRGGTAYYSPRNWSYEEILEAFLREGSVGLRCIALYQIAELGLGSFRDQIEARKEGAHELEAPIIDRTLELLGEAGPA